MLNTSQSRALCTAEIAVRYPLGNIPTDYEIIQINFPESINIHELCFSTTGMPFRTQIIEDSTIGIIRKLYHRDNYHSFTL